MKQRIDSVDLVRGVVMILMAVDHVRVYAGVPAGGPAPAVFFTRWITHFVAPTFVFLAGTSAYLHGRKLGSRGALARFLVTRGVWLVLLELTVIRIAWTFNFDFAHYDLLGVIWVLGACMILLAAAIWLPTPAIATIGIAIIALHNLLPWVDEPAPWQQLVYYGGAIGPLFILYVIVPWIGVMLAGYAFGRVFELEPARRRAITMRIGIAATLLFLALRFVNVYGDPRPWQREQSIIGFLNTAKYPASLQFLLMTLGPILILLARAETWRGRLAAIATTFGRVPLFYYLLHIPLIHIAACIVSLAREGRIDPWLFANHPVMPGPVPPGYRWSLGLLYLVWAICVAVLYVPSRWYARVRAQQPATSWMRYL